MINSNPKKSSSSSSSSSYSKPFSWLSKLKNLRINDSNSNHTKTKQIQNQNQIPFPPSCFEIGGRRTREKIKLKKNDIDLENQRKLLNEDNKSTSMDSTEYDREKEYENIRRRFERKAQQVLEQRLLKIERESKEIEENVPIQFDSPRTIRTPRSHSFVSSNADINKNYSRLRNLKENAISQKKQKQNQNNRKIIERRKAKKVSKVKIYSPRMISKVEMCRIKALEEMRKKAKEKMMKKEVIKEEISISSNKSELEDSFAVIKCSLNPKQDFRDSMIEMIEEKKISKPEEMEELLACYLTLNADEYHDLIIKVFKQVWFDMSQYGLGFKSLMH